MTEREALKLALVTFEEINKLSVGENAICLPAEIDTAMDACRKVLAQPEQEPVAWVCEGSSSDEKHAIDYWPWDVDDLPIGTQLYTSPPPQRTWVGLTDEEIWKFWWSRPEVPEGEDDSMEAEFVAVVRAVLAAHGIKGEA